MKEAPKSIKSWFDLIKQGLLIVFLMISIFAAITKGRKILENQEIISSVKKENEQKKAAILLIESYNKMLQNVEREINDIDKKMEKTIWKESIAWEKLEAIRKEKTAEAMIFFTILSPFVLTLICNCKKTNDYLFSVSSGSVL